MYQAEHRLTAKHTATLRSAQMLSFASHFVYPQNVIRHFRGGRVDGL